MKKNYDIIAFDLDGTLTASDRGITNSMQIALRHFGIERDTESLKRHIGPSLTDTFREYVGDDEEQIQLAIKKYREYYVAGGMLENDLYEGVEETLKEIKNRGKKIILASSKPMVYCEQILKHYGLDKYFDFIGGSNLDETRSKKVEVISFSLENINETPGSNVLMVGDREYDILGAKGLGMDSVGVLFGYGSKEELQEAGATYTIEKMTDLLEIV
ncbi:MAG: HAD hydrolase-like protein [Intestinibacter bartlettii]|uniref:HAD hydrolase-like protein n=1 Tax=Intestinibacter bartlettii TaxID=261299 RepID=UPI0026E92D67|nr:HAD hydrolase-like protein [Intestinibacter bartlettii]MDO5010276.1 HAD hydrolase-like protein [Intestinibacter bartlettii]